MKSIVLSRLTLIWFLLIAATALSWEFGHGIGFDDIRHAGAAIIVISFVKARFVLFEFMEVKHSPGVLRLLSYGWVVLLCAVLVMLFLLAPVV